MKIALCQVKFEYIIIIAIKQSDVRYIQTAADAAGARGRTPEQGHLPAEPPLQPQVRSRVPGTMSFSPLARSRSTTTRATVKVSTNCSKTTTYHWGYHIRRTSCRGSSNVLSPSARSSRRHRPGRSSISAIAIHNINEHFIECVNRRELYKSFYCC